MADTVYHKRSSVVTGNSPKLPSSNQIEYGEIAINYADGYETISIKNSSNNIAVFKDKKYIDNAIQTAINEAIITALNTEV